MIQADHLLRIAGVGIAAGVFAFLLRVLWIPRDDRDDVPFMAAANLPAGATPVHRIKTKADVVAFFQHATEDAELAHVLADAAETNGRDGFVDVRQGGSGRPYAVEYAHRSEEEAKADRRTFAEVRAELDALRAAFRSAATDEDRDRLEREIAWLAGGICTLWINLPTGDYHRRRALIRESVARFKTLCGS